LPQIKVKKMNENQRKYLLCNMPILIICSLAVTFYSQLYRKQLQDILTSLSKQISIFETKKTHFKDLITVSIL